MSSPRFMNHISESNDIDFISRLVVRGSHEGHFNKSYTKSSFDSITKLVDMAITDKSRGIDGLHKIRSWLCTFKHGDE